MSVYMTEEEQIESIKKWWKRHGNLVAVVLSILMLSVAGYRYYNWHHEKVMQQASVAYENMMISFSNHRPKAVKSYANELINQYSPSVYSDVAHLILAKMYINKEKLDQASQQLAVVANESSITTFKQIAKIRMARILAAQKSYTQALEQLTPVDDSYLSVIYELKGDIYNATGQYADAIKSYNLALEQDKLNGIGNLYLEMKTNEMAFKTQSTISNDAKLQNA